MISRRGANHRAKVGEGNYPQAAGLGDVQHILGCERVEFRVEEHALERALIHWMCSPSVDSRLSVGCIAVVDSLLQE